MVEVKKFNIPSGVEPPRSTEPRSMIIYSAPKTGKSSIVAQLPDSLIISHEKNGMAAIKARYIEVFNPNDILPLLAQLKGDDTIKYIVIDTVTQQDSWSEIVGTLEFQAKLQGKKWNVLDSKRLPVSHPSWDSVHSIGNGFGYKYSREVMVKWFKAAINTNKTVIFLAHIKDKFIESKSGDVVEAIDLNLTGKVKSIYSANVDAIAHLKRIGNKSYLNFESMGSSVSGSRYGYLQGSILIGESNPDTYELTTYWENVFTSIKK